MTGPRRGARGFTLVELLVAMAVTAAALAIFLRLAATGQQVLRVRPEAADQLQRLRVALAMLQHDLLQAGAGPLDGADAGPLSGWFAPVLPARTGARGADPELTVATDRISIMSVTPRTIAVPVAAAMPVPASDVMLDSTTPGCPGGGLCGFTVGQRTAIAGGSGLAAGLAFFTVQAAGPGLAHGLPDPPFPRPFDTASRVFAIDQRVYYLDRAAHRLMRYDGYQSDLPLADDIVDLRFDYWLDPSPDAVRAPADGEANCAYAAGSPPIPLLADLHATAPVQASATQLGDGPVCGEAPYRFDADLLRLRRIRVRVRAQVADATLRGRGPLFAVPGTSSGAPPIEPDVEVTLDVTPRNLRLHR